MRIVGTGSLYSTEITNGFMAVEAIDVLIDGSDEYAHLVQITIMDEVGKKLLPVFEYSIIVSIVVEILEPIDEAEAIENEWDLSVVNVEDSQAAFEAIFGKSITFDVSFELINIE